MAKKHKKPNKQKPFVSVCTPTYNRRPFIKNMIKCFDHQDYPKNLIEWIIVDDGTDSIKDLVASHPNVKYYKYDTHMPLGLKRNTMHSFCTGDIIVYMDDDDYYPPTRISHAVSMLVNSQKLIAGCSELYMYVNNRKQMYQLGPYGPNHATAGTFCFKRKLLETTKYDESKYFAEEASFLGNNQVLQLDPKHVILVFSHEHNTFNKEQLITDDNSSKFVKESSKEIEYFMKEPDIKQFFTVDIKDALKNYSFGKLENKPEVSKKLEEMHELRRSYNSKI
jgi:glycosyltransferase involved in cell wall biosynthesis